MSPPLNRAGVHSTLKIYTSIASRQFWSVQITSKHQSSQIRNCTDSNTKVQDTDTNTQLQIYKYKYTSPVVRLDRSRTLQSATQCLVFNFCCQLDIVKPQAERVVSFEIMHFLFLPTHWVSQCNGAIGASISYRLCVIPICHFGSEEFWSVQWHPRVWKEICWPGKMRDRKNVSCIRQDIHLIFGCYFYL